MKGKTLLFLLALCFALTPLRGVEAINVGVYPEVNTQVVDGIAFGGGLLLGVDFLQRWGAGLKTAFTTADGFSALEAQGFIRYNIWRGLFLQAEPGVVFFFKDGESSSAFSGGLAASWRLFPFRRAQNLFLEPTLRFGFPYIMGATMTVGFRFPADSQERQQRQRTPEQILRRLRLPFAVEGDYLRLRLEPVYFAQDLAGDEGLSDAVIAANNATLRRVAEAANNLEGNRVIVEGHSNPLSAEGDEAQEAALVELSRNRAQWVIQQLAALDVAPDRFEVRGVGTSSVIAPFVDVDNAWRNRRVEFLIAR